MKSLNIKTTPLLPYGWTIESHTPIGKFNLDKVILHLEPEQKKSYIKGAILQERLKNKKCLDASVLDYLLKNPQLIPAPWKGKYVFFWGTIYRSSVGGLYVRYLCWDGGGWGWCGHWLGGVFVGDYPAVVSQVSAQTSDTLPSSDTQSLALRVKALEQTVEKLKKALE